MEDALRIQNETGKAQNTATRVGSLFVAIVEALGEIVQAGLIDGSVTTDKIADGAVTLAKLSEELRNLINGGGGGTDAYTKAEVDAIKNGLRDDINEYSRFFDSEMGDVWGVDARQNADIAGLRGGVNAIQAATLNMANTMADFRVSEIAARMAAETAMRQAVAQLVNQLANYYTKAEVGNILSNTPETDVVVADALTSINDSESDYYVAPADRANKLFRIPGPDNTSYSEYAWDGTDFVPLDTKEYGIDTEPTKDSTNLMESGGLYDYLIQFMKQAEDVGFKFVVADDNDTPVVGLDKNDILCVFLDVILQNVEMKNLLLERITQVDSINGIEAVKVKDVPGWKVALCDSDDNLIVGLSESGQVVSGVGGSEEGTDSTSSVVSKSAVYERNKDKEPYLLADCFYEYNPGYYTRGYPDYDDPSKPNYSRDHTLVDWRTKRLQLLLTTDTHLENTSFQNAIKAAADFESVDAILHLGDFTNWVNIGDDNYPLTAPIIESATKPLYMTPGNHDVGTRCSFVKYCKDDIQIYNRFIKPSVDRGFLTSGEYLPGRCYYFHDFDQYKVRLIMLYPYDDGNVFEEDYWEHVTYNPSYDDIAVKTYNQGEFVNVPGYDSFSFRAKQLFSVDQIGSTLGNWVAAYARVPRFKTVRSLTWYQQAQLDWFCQALEGAGQKGYTAVVCQHEIVFDSSNYDGMLDSHFHNPRSKPSGDFTRYKAEDKEIIAQIVNAYQTKGKITKTIIPQESMHSLQGPDDVSSMTPVVLNHTFAYTGKVVFLHGHNHNDVVGRHKNYDELSIGFAPGTLFDCASTDLYRRDEDSRSKDTMTAVTIHEERVNLTRIGCDVTGIVDPVTHTLRTRINESLGISKDYVFEL